MIRAWKFRKKNSSFYIDNSNIVNNDYLKLKIYNHMFTQLAHTSDQSKHTESSLYPFPSYGFQSRESNISLFPGVESETEEIRSVFLERGRTHGFPCRTATRKGGKRNPRFSTKGSSRTRRVEPDRLAKGAKPLNRLRLCIECNACTRSRQSGKRRPRAVAQPIAINCYVVV